MILAKSRLMGPTIATARGARETADRTLRTMPETVAPRTESTHMEITFRIPSQKGLELIKMIQNPSANGGTPILLKAGADGALELVSQSSAEPLSETQAAPTDLLGLKAGELLINPGRHEVLHNGRMISSLTFTEFGILHFLAKHAGWVYSREQIVEGVKGKNYPVTDRAVDVQVAGLRKKLGTAADHIQTVRGVGYRFKDQS